MRIGQDAGPPLSHRPAKIVSGGYSAIISAESFKQLCMRPRDDVQQRVSVLQGEKEAIVSKQGVHECVNG